MLPMLVDLDIEGFYILYYNRFSMVWYGMDK